MISTLLSGILSGPKWRFPMSNRSKADDPHRPPNTRQIFEFVDSRSFAMSCFDTLHWFMKVDQDDKAYWSATFGLGFMVYALSCLPERTVRLPLLRM